MERRRIRRARGRASCAQAAPGIPPRESLRAARSRVAERSFVAGAVPARRRRARRAEFARATAFRRDGANLRRAFEWAQGQAAPRDRHQRGFVLSAARSVLFNEVFAARVRRGDWNRLLPGEAVMLDGRRLLPRGVDDASLEQRCQDMDVHPSGPPPGAETRLRRTWHSRSSGRCSRGTTRSPHCLCRNGWTRATQPAAAGTRVRLEFERDDELVLRFTLPRGTFATAVLHELLADAWDVGEEE